jgi:hypothetical protein
MEPGRGKSLSLLHSAQTGYGAHPAFYKMGIGGSSPEVNRPVRETDHSLPSSAEVKNGVAVPPLLHTSTWHSA